MNAETETNDKPPKKKKRIKSKGEQAKSKMAQSNTGTPACNSMGTPLCNPNTVLNSTLSGNMNPQQSLQFTQFSQPQYPMANISPQSFYQQGYQQIPTQQVGHSNTMLTEGASPHWNQEICARLDQISKRLDKLDIIENSVSALKRDVKSLTDRVIDVEKSQQFHSQMWEETKAVQDKNMKHMDDNINEIKKALDVTIQENERLGNEIVDLQCRSMRNNLLFYNFVEAGDEEMCIDVIQQFCKNQLGLEDNIELDRAHRVGPKRTGKIRPIVAKFRIYQQRELVRKCSHKLKGTPFSIGEQFPKVVQERRNKLVPVFKKARAEGKRASLVRDKRFIDGRLYGGGADHMERMDVSHTVNPNRKK